MKYEPKPETWFLGTRAEYDGEWITADHCVGGYVGEVYDGKIYAPPTKEEQDAEAATRAPDYVGQGYEAEPHVVAEVEMEADARFILKAVQCHKSFLAACEAMLQSVDRWIARGGVPTGREADDIEMLRLAVARAKEPS